MRLRPADRALDDAIAAAIRDGGLLTHREIARALGVTGVQIPTGRWGATYGERCRFLRIGERIASMRRQGRIQAYGYSADFRQNAYALADREPIELPPLIVTRHPG